jgi:drug/metabolite transporter (DMT)-like permease
MSKTRTVAIWWIVCFLWSSTFLFIKLGLRDIPPFTFAWMRLAIAVSVLAPLSLLNGRPRTPSVRDAALFAVTGLLLLGVNYGLLFWGTQFIPSGLAAILQSATPVLALLFGWSLKSESVTGLKLVAVMLGVAGVAIIFGSEAAVSGSAALAGSAAVFAGSLCVALAYVGVKTYGRHVPPTMVAAVQSLAGVIPLACVAFAVEGAPHPALWSRAGWLALLYLSLVASGAAFWMNYWLLARMDASAMLMMGVAEVPIAIGLGAVVFGERLPSGTLVGGVCVLAAVAAALKGTPRTAA